MSIVTNETFENHLDLLKEIIQRDQTIVLDVETNGLDSYGSHQICGVGVGEADPMGLMQYYPILILVEGVMGILLFNMILIQRKNSVLKSGIKTFL